MSILNEYFLEKEDNLPAVLNISKSCLKTWIKPSNKITYTNRDTFMPRLELKEASDVDVTLRVIEV